MAGATTVHRRTINRSLAVFAFMAPATAAVAIAQLQVDNRVNPQLYPAGTSAQNYRPNDYSVGESIYYRTPRQIGLLPSEVRMAEQRSGALPSELLIARQQAGPLNPYGALAYIPNQSPVQQLMRLPPPQLYNPAYNLSPALAQSQSSGPGVGSINYSGYSRLPTNGPISSPPMQSGWRPQPTHTIRTGPPTTTVSERIEPAELNSELNPSARMGTGAGSGSVYFSSINPPRLSP